MNIKDVIPVAGRSGFFNRDLAAVKAGTRADGFAYPGKPLSPGFTKIVQPGTAISLMLLLDDGQVAFGDCTDVILTGVADLADALDNPARIGDQLLAVEPNVALDLLKRGVRQ